MSYEAFLAEKHAQIEYSGFERTIDDINPAMFPFQRDITRWALKLGRAAIFAERGLGKTFMEGEWARHVAEETGKPVLIVAPKAVAITQTVPELAKWRIQTQYVTSQAEADGLMIAVTNYERVDAFDMSQFSGLVLDESSILKNFTGKTKTKLVDMDLSVRALNCLKAAEVDTLGDLVSFNKNDLMKFRNFGKKSLTELEELVINKGLSFGMDLSKYKLDKD